MYLNHHVDCVAYETHKRLLAFPLQICFCIQGIKNCLIEKSLLIKVNLVSINKPLFNWNITEYQLLHEWYFCYKIRTSYNQ